MTKNHSNKQKKDGKGSLNDSGISGLSQLQPHDVSTNELLLKILKHCEDNRESNEKKINVLEQKIDQLIALVKEQKEEIKALKSENNTMKEELSESTCNHFQQQQLLNTIEITGLNDTPHDKITDAIEKIALSVNVKLSKEEISAVRRLNNGKTTATIVNKAKCNDLVAASFKNFITNQSTQPYNKASTTSGRKISQRIYISNAMTPLNQKIYKQLRDMKKNGFFNRISFFNGIFSVHQQGKQYPINITSLDQLQSLQFDQEQDLCQLILQKVELMAQKFDKVDESFSKLKDL